MARGIAAGLALVLAALVAAVPSPAAAARALEVSIMDDQLLLGASKADIDRSMDEFVALGVDRLRVSAFWNAHAPEENSTRKPSFDAANPFDPAYRWDALDRVIVSAAERGLSIMVSISTPGPIWASSSPSRRNPVWKPRPEELRAFSTAVAGRYGAVVDHYGLLNEPNQGAWLQPQSDRRGHVAPHLYRELARAAHAGVKAGDPDSVTLLGELAPSGRDDRGTTRPIRPLSFLRSMGCVTRSFRSTRSGRCRGFRRVTADAIGHHPYSLFSAPTRRSAKRDDAAIGDGRRLLSTLDRLVRRRALRPTSGRRFDVYYTEFGYQTDPPDPFAGIPLSRQDRWLQDAAYEAWRTPRVRGINQFRLTDGEIDQNNGTEGFREFQSGLKFASARAKPAYRSFPHPIVLRRTGRRGLYVWGQARPGGRHTVSVERRLSGSRRYRRIKRVRTDSRGYFRIRTSARAGHYRFRYSSRGVRGTSQPARLR